MKNLLDKLHRYEAYVPVYLRVGLGIIFLTIGINLLLKSRGWSSIIPQFLGPTPLGFIEVIIGAALLLGFQHQLAAIGAGIQIIVYAGIVVISPYNGGYGIYSGYELVIISMSLLTIAISLAVTPETIFSIDAWKERKRLERLRP